MISEAGFGSISQQVLFEGLPKTKRNRQTGD